MFKYSRAIKFISTFLILIAVLVPAASASAALRICRTDPLIFFTDGNILSVTAAIAGDAQDVSEIVYTIYAPAGSQVAKIVHTAGGLGLLETVNVIDDQPQGVFRVETIVYTEAESSGVTAIVMLAGGKTTSTSGQTGDNLVVTVSETNARRK